MSAIDATSTFHGMAYYLDYLDQFMISSYTTYMAFTHRVYLHESSEPFVRIFYANGP